MLPPTTRRRYLYLASTGRILNLSHPRTFLEKVHWRILNDRRTELGQTCDKLWMKAYARSRVSDPTLRIPTTRWYGQEISAVPPEALVGRWVLKPNHGSGKVLFGELNTPTLAECGRRTTNWLDDEQSIRLGEWAYSKARRLFLIEDRISTTDAPIDYKFFVFAGRVALVQVDFARFERHKRTLYSPDWEPIGGNIKFPEGPPTKRPPELEQMIDIAERLGAGWDFLRIDLYAASGQVWFGETTPYPGGGIEQFNPSSLDTWLGDLWTLPQPTAEGDK